MGKITSYTALTTPQPDDVLVIVDVHDQAMAPTGTDKQITVANLQAGLAPATSGSSVLKGNGSGGTTAAVAGTDYLAPAEVGAANGIAALDSGGLVPRAELGGAGTGTTTSKFAPLLYGAVWGRAYQFYADSYGAAGNGRAVTDGVMTTGAATSLACASSSPFASGDVGKAVLVSTAKGAFAPLAATISAFTDSAHVTLSGSATANTTGTPGAITVFGTDDATALNALISAADTYGRAHGTAELLLDPTAIYVTASAFQVGAAASPGNYMLGLPNVPQAGQHYQLAIIGGQDSMPFVNWAQLVPGVSNAVIACLRTDGTNNGSNGPAHILGGPVNGYGGESGAATGWSNLHLVVRGLSTLSPYNATFGGLDMFAIATQDIESFSALCMAVIPAASAPSPSMATPSNISNQWGWGIRFASSGNNADIRAGKVLCEGHCYGIGPSEHAVIQSARAVANITGIESYSGNGITMVHSGTIVKATVESCTNALGALDGIVRLDILCLDTESISGKQIFDPSNRLQGYVNLRPQNAAGFYATSGQWVNGGSGVRVINGMTTPGPVASPQAAPASGSPWFNGYYHDAEVTLSVATGTLSALVTDAVAETLPASCTLYKFTVPSGHSYTPTYTGTLTHTVKLS